MSISILGLGTAVPEHVMSQKDALEMAQAICHVDDRQRRLMSVLYRKSGVANRQTCLPHRIAFRWLPKEPNSANSDSDGPLSAPTTMGPTTGERMQFYEEHAFPLVRQAAEKALQEAGVKPADISHIVTVSCTGFYSPGLDIQLIQQLGMRPTTERVNVGFMGCHGALNGLRVARALAAQQPDVNVLLCAVELCCLHYRFQWDPEQFLGNALFGDGAAAAVIGRPPTQSKSWRVSGTGSRLIPDSRDAMSWRVGDYGFEMKIASNVPDLIRQHLRAWIADWLGQHGMSVEQVENWAVHPGGPRILDAVGESLNLQPQALAPSREVLSEHGNMSSPTVFFILDRMRRRAVNTPCVVLGFGPGLVAEVVLLT